MTVCIIDDNPIVLDALGVALGDEGYDVVSAETWPQAQMLLLARAVGAVVTDLEMPSLMTAQIVALVRQNFASMPIIAISASADPRIGEKAKANGADLFLAKPVSGAEIAKALRTLAGQGRAVRGRL